MLSARASEKKKKGKKHPGGRKHLTFILGVFGSMLRATHGLRPRAISHHTSRVQQSRGHATPTLWRAALATPSGTSGISTTPSSYPFHCGSRWRLLHLLWLLLLLWLWGDTIQASGKHPVWQQRSL